LADGAAVPVDKMIEYAAKILNVCCEKKYAQQFVAMKANVLK
jgi:hypothetical protein